MVCPKLIKKANELRPRTVWLYSLIARDDLAEALDASLRDFHAAVVFLHLHTISPLMQSHVDTYHLPGSMKLSAPHSTALERGAKRKRDRAFVCPIPHRTVWLLFLDPRRLRPCCGPIPFTETFPAPAISALDKAWSQVVATAVAADQLLGFGLTP